MPPPLELLACPACRGPLGAGLTCPACALTYPADDGIPDLRRPGDARSEAVRAFYAVAPFPGYPPRLTLGQLRARAQRSELARALDAAIAGDARVLEVGCGTGQMSLYLASADRVVVGADFQRASLRLGAAAAARLGIAGVAFVETDLNAPGLCAGAFDVVLALGVLHHTADPSAAFAAVAPLVRPGGVIVVTLYHTLARLPHRLRRGLARLTGFRRVPFDPILAARADEPERRAAWLRDQYLHPEEHRHLLGEVRRWLGAAGFTFVRTLPSSLFGARPLAGAELFDFAADDDWRLETALTQLGWIAPLASEGGVFAVVGRRSAAATCG
jgi:SAM-dependent methyltransferase